MSASVIFFFILAGVTFDCVTGRVRSARRNIQGISMRELSISSSASFRYAHVLVRSLVENTDTSDHELMFRVRIPYEAFITNFSIITNDNTYNAIIKDKNAAYEEYQKAKEDGISAGTITQQTSVADDRDRDIFRVKVNVAAQTTLEFRLHYEEMLLKNAGKYSQKIYIDVNSFIVPQLEVICELKEKQRFKEVTYQTPLSVESIYSDEEKVTEDGYYIRKFEWKVSEADQIAANDGFLKPFEIEYELEPSENGGMVYINDNGEFVHMFSTLCEEANVMMKQIVFVIDISGSMAGNPIKQVRQTMYEIFKLLRSNDFFNIIIFNKDALLWNQQFQKATVLNIESATLFVEKKVVAEGSTNINDALLKAVALFGQEQDGDNRVGQIVVFLTDGEPTVGVQNPDRIRRNVRDKNFYGGKECCKSSIFTIAFGSGAATDFLDALANENEGFLKVIRDKNDGEDILELYNGVENPYLKDIIFSFKAGDEDVPEENTTRTEYRQYDCGNEIVVAGVTFPGAELRPVIQASNSNGTVSYEDMQIIRTAAVDENRLSRLLAYQRVKHLLKQAEIIVDGNKLSSELMKEKALNISLHYGFVTPLTSLIVTEYSPKKMASPPANRMGALAKSQSGSSKSVQYDLSNFFYDDTDFDQQDIRNKTNSANNFAVNNSMCFVLFMVILSLY
jgi:inter-alpha-trypsin inhibitor heavy chain H1